MNTNNPLVIQTCVYSNVLVRSHPVQIIEVGLYYKVEGQVRFAIKTVAHGYIIELLLLRPFVRSM